MKSFIYGLPLYLFAVVNLIFVWYCYLYNQEMIEREYYSLMVKPWKPMLLSWAVITLYVFGMCIK